MLSNDLLIELDAESGFARRNHVAVLPAYGLLQDPGVEAVPALDALENQEVGTAGRQLDVGGPHDGATVQVWRDLHMIDFRHAGDLLGLQDAADTAQIHLQDGGASSA